MFLSLDLLRDVVNRLPHEERLECMLVCRHWHDELYGLIRKAICLETRRQVRSFFETVSQPHNRLKDVVRILDVYNVGLSRSQIEQLPQLLPRLERLEFGSRVWSQMNAKQMQWLGGWQRIKELPVIPSYRIALSCLDQVKTLTHLFISEMLAFQFLIQSAQMKKNHTLLLRDSFYARVPNLTHFQYTAPGLSNHPFDMRVLFDTCPHLEHLMLRNCILKEETNYAPVPVKLKQLRLTQIPLESPAPLLFIANTCASTLTHFHLMFHWEPPFHATDAHKEALRVLARALTRVRSLQILDVLPAAFPTDFFSQLAARGHLTHLRLMFQLEWLSDLESDHDLVGYATSSLGPDAQQLELQSWDMWDELSSTLQLVQPLAYHAPNLRELSLHGDPNLGSSYTTTQFELNVILNSCDNLKTLKLYWADTHYWELHQVQRYENFEEDPDMVAMHGVERVNDYKDHLKDQFDTFERNRGRKHGLTSLSFEQSRLAEPALEYIAARCPHLEHLRIVNSSFDQRKQDFSMRIDMREQTFKSVELRGLRLATQVDEEFETLNDTPFLSVARQDDILARKVRQARHPRGVLDDHWTKIRRHVRHYYCYSLDGEKRQVELMKLANVERMHAYYTQALADVLDRVGDRYFVTEVGERLTFDTRTDWKNNLPCGRVSLVCRDADRVKFNNVDIDYHPLSIQRTLQRTSQSIESR
ncbi:hypothetical protein BCR43DRAFT_493228 [Syncephalastrum racemosum]|uniref:F-box domain-containing protein n=1 Tax=Syncephalastrum racemosum TaxID=13706 RepID=A0A1X2HAB9_SYNRA|nr:hypothetical protein BCR43DRAFT_493228 [Syncephalastrum racemosum]